MDAYYDIAESLTAAFFIVPLKAYFQDTNSTVNYPFIDEIFHYTQTKQYCDGNFKDWNPKITTPPGLYYLGYLYTKYMDVDCSLENLRFVNFIGGLSIVLLTFWIRKRFDNWSLTSLSLFLNPLITLYYSLYYTDVWSSVLVLASYTVALTEPFKFKFVNSVLAAILGLLSLGIRQTNIIWIAFIAAAFIDTQIKRKKLYKNEFLVEDLTVFIKQSLKNWALLTPFAINFGLFAAFLKYNGGLTFGDQENHGLVFHPVQVFYCFTFLTVFTIPLWLSYDFFYQYIVENFFRIKGLLFNSFWIPTMIFFVSEFTIVHPFLLADNRHYTFYIMRRLILQDEYSRYKCIVAYHFSCYTIYKQIMNNISKANFTASSLVMCLAYFVAVILSLVPSPLFEPRYYIPAFMCFRIMVAPSEVPILRVNFFTNYNKFLRLAGEVLWYFLWTQALYVMFLTFTFDWPTEEFPQRLIW